MALETCGSCLSCLLVPLALWSVVVNILLYFPNGNASYVASYQHPNYVWYFEGICFSGVMVSVDLWIFNYLQDCSHTEIFFPLQSFISIVLAMLGVAFSGYSCIIFTLGLIQGPFCNSSSGWDYIFKDTVGGYLTDYSAWSQCTEPANAVEWSIILLSILITLSGLQLIICFLKQKLLCNFLLSFICVHEEFRLGDECLSQTRYILA
uniref:Transmembrane 4 L six family member 18 n=1 Tax=Phasianus colchicus TaxID=9054 RepID=A0A669Q3W2_PHACC